MNLARVFCHAKLLELLFVATKAVAQTAHSNKLTFLSLSHHKDKFKEQVEKRGGAFRDTVYCFGEEEGEAWCLLRWCRARKFNFDELIKMVEEATQTRAEAAKQGFYPDPKAALGCDMSLYFAQYPQLYSGFAKNGAPLFISKPGVLNVDAVEQITTLEGILEFHWFIMMHDFGDRLRQQKKDDPNFKRFECVCILDLENLTTAQLTSRSLAIIKTQAAVDSVCFPETMNKMFIINGPFFFSATWSIIKGWLDPRTSSKIEVISSRKAWEKRLLDLVESDSLPCDYGGTGPDTKLTLAASQPGDMKRLQTEVMYVR
jgi:CRAL/TRIO domain